MTRKDQEKSLSQRSKYFRNKENLIFILVPASLFVFMLFRLTEIHAFYQVWLDPVYAYLMNGLTFALGSNDIGLTGHPGTPLQLLIALLIRIWAVFRGPADLAIDVLTHPESYLYFITLVLIALNCIALWFLGVAANRFLKNRSLSMIVQLAPLLVFQLVNFLPVAACETVVVFASLAIVSGLLLYEMQENRQRFWLIWVAFFSALMMATKISTAAMLILPFLFFAKNKQRVTFAFLTLAMAVLFVLPVWEKLSDFTGFLAQMATHTGQYGSGEAKLFDAAIYLRSLGRMMTKEWTFSLHVLLIPIGWLVIFRRKLKGQLSRFYLALSVATFLQMAVVARHYSFHYLMPVFSLAMPLHVIFWFKVFSKEIETWRPRLLSLVAIILVAGVFARLVWKNHFSSEIVNPVNHTSETIQKEFRGKYIVLTDFSNGFAMIDPALRFGYSYCGATAKIRYLPILASHYPENYFWNIREEFSNLNGNLLASDIFSNREKVYLYANAGDCLTSRQKIAEMVELSGISGFLQLKDVFRNEESGDMIVEAKADTAQVRKFSYPKLTVETNMDELTPDHESFRSNYVDFVFKGGSMQSDRFARSGKFSLLLTKSGPFGGNISMPVKSGKRFKAEFWQRSSDGKQALVVAAASLNDIFYKTSSLGQNNSEEWTRSELNIALPVDFAEDVLNFYLYNPSSDSVWIEDFSLKVFE